ncbi:glycosyltransferase involved in cell wall biosynthesis [Stella humosa]|uniref:Glycosyltransferase involved in cell wall biosynthesis n=1 Tax=Stella humosa TaxID=94 RepID=A0A3N1M369_9PROT|nr:glycosyltransferase family 4 protein [Stella humosa]ROQ02014.1 glycosyltransferase involved in cell wall biosynthesis [Stella humosa]
MRVLHLVHNHPSLHPGGTEIFARELFQALRADGDNRQLLVAAVDDLHRRPHPGTRFQSAGAGADELLLWAGHFDRFQLNQADTEGTLFELGELAEGFRPDIIHFHHLLRFGANAVPFLRRVCPEARFVLSLHDYYPLCHRDGVLLRNPGNERCDGPSPNACNGCFPDISPGSFLVRDLMLKAHLTGFDRFVAPSRFLRDRYLAWGLPADRLVHIANGRDWPLPAPPRAGSGPRNRFAVLGNLSVYKGTTVALDAARRLADAGVDFSLDIHGAPRYQTEAFTQRIEADVRALGSRARHHGAYEPADVAGILAAADWVIVPSIWWENAPLVIDEAMHHGRPVLCSGIGGMAERVRNGIDGLHFRAGDPLALADTMARAATEDGLWQRLSGGIGPVRTVADAADEHMALYRELLTPRVAAIAEPAADTAAKRRRPLVRGEGVSPARA